MRLITILCLVFVLKTFAQQSDKTIISLECKEEANPIDCSYLKLINQIKSELNNLNLETKGYDGVIVVSGLLHFEKDGTLNPEKSIFYSKEIDIESQLDPLLKNIPAIIPHVSDKGNLKPFTYRDTFYFHYDNGTFNFATDAQPKLSDFYVPQTVPVFPGCKAKWTNKKLRNCMDTKISEHLVRSFNPKIWKLANLKEGSKTRIAVAFTVDGNGNITNIFSSAKHQLLKTEAERVMKTVPKFKPAYLSRKATSTSYALPILVQVAYKD